MTCQKLSREQIKFKVGKINFDRGKEVLGEVISKKSGNQRICLLFDLNLIIQYYETGAISGLSHQGHTVRAKCQVRVLCFI